MKLWYLHYININKFYNNLAIFNITLKQVFPYSSQLIYIVKKIEKKKNSFYFFQVKNLTFKIWRSKLFRFLFFFSIHVGLKKEREGERNTRHPIGSFICFRRQEGAVSRTHIPNGKETKHFFYFYVIYFHAWNVKQPRGDRYFTVEARLVERTAAIVSVRWRNKLRSERIILSKVDFAPERMEREANVTTVHRKWIINIWNDRGANNCVDVNRQTVLFRWIVE